MNGYKLILAVTLWLLLLFAIGHAAEGKKAPPADPVQDEEINWQVISSGGGRSTSAAYVLNGTLAQTAVGYGSSADYGLSHGYWQEFGRGGCCLGIRGNVDGDPDDRINVADLTYLVEFLFRGGPPPLCMEEGNVSGDPEEQVNVGDLTYLVDYLFRGGPTPPPCPYK